MRNCAPMHSVNAKLQKELKIIREQVMCKLEKIMNDAGVNPLVMSILLIKCRFVIAGY